MSDVKSKCAISTAILVLYYYNLLVTNHNDCVSTVSLLLCHLLISTLESKLHAERTCATQVTGIATSIDKYTPASHSPQTSSARPHSCEGHPQEHGRGRGRGGRLRGRHIPFCRRCRIRRSARGGDCERSGEGGESLAKMREIGGKRLRWKRGDEEECRRISWEREI